MKKHLSSIIFGCLGLCAGFTLCYVYVVIPESETNLALRPPPQIYDSFTTTINLAGDGSLYLEGKRFRKSQLNGILDAQAAWEKPVVIRAARGADFASISAILDACKTAGVRKVAFATEPAE